MDYEEIVAGMRLLFVQSVCGDPALQEMISVLRANGCPAKAIIAYFDHLMKKQKE